MKSLIIVESPTKAKTIKNFLGSDYEVIASKGHIRDLPKHSFGIKIEEGTFIPDYKIEKAHEAILKEIKSLAKKAQHIYIATDEDREGEAIGYHISCAIDKDPLSLPRIVFHEITKGAIKHALETPRAINMDMVNAQQARRLLDRIVGYRLSPLIASKIQKGLSAGRVQSSALKIIVDREREIRAFVPIVYYRIPALFERGIEAELIEYQGAKVEKLTLQNEKEAKAMVAVLSKESWRIKEIENKHRKVSAPPPFMTSTLQQSANSLLGFSPSRTMSTAQKLYEGVMTHKGIMGVITYMRTDSLNIAKEAQSAAREHIKADFGVEYLPAKAKIYTTKNKSAQEAHEAIRPTLMDFTPHLAAQYLKGDELKLYTLIYNRFLASQMNDAEFELQNIFIASKEGIFKASGRKLVFDGFYRVLGSEDKDKLLPALKSDEALKIQKCECERHETEPPARYSEASIIKTMESLGIGRPSTYAPTISLLASREYITIEKKQIAPQEVAFQVIEMLEVHFNEIVDSHFTASLEEELDEIAEAKKEWQGVLWEFYKKFDEKIALGKKNIASQKMMIPTGEFCPKCGLELVRRKSRYGEFIACSGYPKCKYIKPNEDSRLNEASDEVCEKCGKPMVKKRGRNGEFLACSGYPECRNTKSLKSSARPKKVLEIPCPKCGGEIVERSSRRGTFYGCANYPKCKFISAHEPTSAKCDKCGGVMAKRMYRKKEVLECIDCKERVEVKEAK
ncbi:MAG: type I DNA topoisomerase [Wolinella sp.]